LNLSHSPHANPAASAAYRSHLPDVAITAAHVDDGRECAVCKDAFAVGGTASALTCGHLFHGACIVPWLERSATCPVCRTRLPREGEDAQPSV
jgi:E3 ubiquitin-protein ligase RNF115/126